MSSTNDNQTRANVWLGLRIARDFEFVTRIREEGAAAGHSPAALFAAFVAIGAVASPDGVTWRLEGPQKQFWLARSAMLPDVPTAAKSAPAAPTVKTQAASPPTSQPAPRMQTDAERAAEFARNSEHWAAIHAASLRKMAPEAPAKQYETSAEIFARRRKETEAHRRGR